ncbi:MAG: HEAT repeat domain-containing protein [Fimbriimonadaceae bacterium]|nr:HEAT repeat domain-containing protein [Fimbriimonadaceae bacterium]
MKAARRALYEEVTQRMRCEWVIVLTGLFADFDRQRVETIAQVLRELLKDANLRIDRVESGSVKLIIKSSQATFEMMQALFQAGEIEQLLESTVLNVYSRSGIDVLDISVVPPAVPSLIADLQDDHLVVRRINAIFELGKLGPSAWAAIPALCDALQDETVRASAAWALKRIGPTAVTALIQVLRHSNPDHQINASYALAQIGSSARDAIPDLIERLRTSGDAMIRDAAAEALKKIDTDASVNPIGVSTPLKR